MPEIGPLFSPFYFACKRVGEPVPAKLNGGNRYAVVAMQAPIACALPLGYLGTEPDQQPGLVPRLGFEPR